MVQAIYCSGCKAALYEGLELESPLEIIQRYGGACPECGKKLIFDPDKMKMSPILANPSARDYKKWLEQKMKELGLKPFY